MAKRRTPIRHDPVVSLFAERLRALRRATGFTQAQLARLANVTETYISKLEKAQIAPGVDLIARLSRALNCPISDLLPSSPPDLDALKEQVRSQFEAVLRSADSETLQLVLRFLARLGELSVCL
jgi:transcriptional regulator with XRE-family HTH domain